MTWAVRAGAVRARLGEMVFQWSPRRPGPRWHAVFGMGRHGWVNWLWRWG